jgi:hypothetical protein
VTEPPAAGVTTLIVVVYGAIYERYAADLLADADALFNPTEDIQIITLPGEAGWPNASACRYRIILQHTQRLRGDYLYLLDADSRIESPIGAEILPPGRRGTVVTTHPGYPDPGQPDAPWEDNPASLAYVEPAKRTGPYHPGAFVGGARNDFLYLAANIALNVKLDAEAGVAARWYDEAHLNKHLTVYPPAVVLPGDFCYWDYWGPEPGPRGERRRIVHLDKTPAEFDARGSEAQT